MNKLYFLFFISFLLASKTDAQTCMGKHNDNFTLLTSQEGVEFYYRINHCQEGDEILIQITNNNVVSVNVSLNEKIFSANQVYTTSAPINFQIPAQSTLSPTACSQTISPLQLIGVTVFPNEQPMQLLNFELSNIIIQ